MFLAPVKPHYIYVQVYMYIYVQSELAMYSYTGETREIAIHASYLAVYSYEYIVGWLVGLL